MIIEVTNFKQSLQHNMLYKFTDRRKCNHKKAIIKKAPTR